jgi:uncharacterized membrane protein
VQFFFSGGPGYWGPALAVDLLALLLAIWRAPWRLLRADLLRQHALAAAVLGLATFWLLKVHVQELFLLHPLLMMWVVMVFGPSLAIVIGIAAFALNASFVGLYYPGQFVSVLFTIVVPVCAAVMVLKVIERVQLRNLFVYLLGGGFIGAMVTILAMAGLQLLYIELLGPEPLMVIALDNYYLNLLMMFPEGFINGAIITLLTVFTPDLVKTYDDRHYLG